MKNIYNKPVILFATAATLLFSAKVEAASFNFTNIADNSNYFTLFGDYTGSENGNYFTSFGTSRETYYSINDNGTVAFQAFGNNDRNRNYTGIFTSNGDYINLIARRSTAEASLLYGDINNQDIVTYLAVFESGNPRTALLASDNDFQRSIVTTEVYPISFSTNNNNDVAFSEHYDGIYTSSKKTLVRDYDPPTNISDDQRSIIRFFDVDINDNNTVVALVSFIDTFNTISDPGIFKKSGNKKSTIIGDLDFQNAKLSVGQPQINNNDTIVFPGRLSQKSTHRFIDSGIFTIDSTGVISNIAGSNNSSFDFFRGASINDNDTVAFWARLDDGSSGIFTGSDPVNDKVITTGDSLFGSTVTSISCCLKKSINNSGQIVFDAILDDGTHTIVRADPVPTSEVSIPESSSVLSLLGMGAVGCLIRFFRRFY